MQRAGGVRQVRGAFTLEVGHHHYSAGSRLGGQGKLCQGRQVHAEHGRRGIEHPGAIECADQRQVMAGRVGEPGDQPAGIRAGGFRDGKDRTGSAYRDHDVAGPGVDTQRGAGVVAGAGGNQLAGRGFQLAAQRRQDPGQNRHVPQGLLQHLGQVGPLRRRPVPGAGGIGAVGAQRFQADLPAARAVAGQPPAQPVVRQAHRSGAGGVFRLVVGQPPQLRGGDRSHRHGPDGLGPVPGSVLPRLGDQVRRGLRGTGVVPQQGRAHHGTIGVKADHAVLLRRNGDGVDVVQPSGRRGGLLERGPPGFRVHFRPGRMRSGPAPQLQAGLGIADDNLAGLSGAVHSSNQGHGRAFPGGSAWGRITTAEVRDAADGTAPRTGFRPAAGPRLRTGAARCFRG